MRCTLKQKVDLLESVLELGNCLVVLIGIGILSQLTPARRWGAWLILVVALIMLVVTVSPLPSLLVTSLEARFPSVGQPREVDGILVLGGALDPKLSRKRTMPSMSGASERLFALAGLVRQYPNTKIIYCGGEESKFVKSLLMSIGTDLHNVSFDHNSRNTYDNALFAKNFVSPLSPGGAWLLVTSAYHMPRAVGVFRAQGWNVIPYPVDYQTDGDYELELHFDFYRGLQLTQTAMHEWLGLVAYYVLGWTTDLFPGPKA